MSTVDDTASKAVEPPCQSSWDSLRAVAVSEETKFSQTDIKPASLLGAYAAVWDSYTMLEIMDDIGEEYSWMNLSINDPEKLKNPSFADIEGRFRWWRKVGSFKGLTRPKDSKENLWLVNGVTWSADVDEDDEPYECDDRDDDAPRATNDFGLACLVTVDDARKPFLEMLYKTSERGYVRVIWKKQEEGCTGLLMLSDGEGRRLTKDGAADLSETRDISEDENENKDEEAAEGDLDEELGVESRMDLKRRAEEEEEGPGVKRPKK